jgi:2-dehydro-3-deoxyphosphogluconate aldolase/(4S)-4-hydroxy-2-oxoglutarate aldolase
MTTLSDLRTHPARVLSKLREHRLIAVIRSSSAAEALGMSRALAEAGVRAIEVTYTTPDASDVIGSLKAELEGTVLVGAGTVHTPEKVRMAAGSGADFLVSAGAPPALIEVMLSTDLLVVPGVFTATEIITAHSLGVLAVKLFPASVVGPAGLKSLRGPFPDLPVIATGGITLDQIDDWLDAGAHAVGVGADLMSKLSDGGVRRDSK